MRKSLAALMTALFLCALMGAARTAWAATAADGENAPEVAVRINKNAISLGDSLRLAVTVKNADDARADLSPVMDFQVLSEEKGASLTLEDKVVTRSVTLSYRLVPLKLGTLRIPALTVRAGGETLTTKPLEVTVMAEAPSGDGGENGRLAYLETETSRAAPYVGEEFLYKTRIYRSVPLASASLRDPDFTGFAAKRVPGQRDFETLKDKITYMVSEVTYLLTPLSPGARLIKGATLQCEIVRNDSGGAASGIMPFYLGADVESKILSAPSVTITARALPPYAGKDPFSGLIGEFTLSASASQKELTEGGSATLTLTLAGKGNIVDAPEIPVTAPDGVKIYKDAPETRTGLTDSGYEGQSVQRHSLTPLRAGTFTLGPFTLTYFDPRKERYETASSEALTFVVAPGAKRDSAEEAGAAPGNPAANGADGAANAGKAQAAPETPGAGNEAPGGLTPLYPGLDALHDERPLSLGAFVLLLCVLPALYVAAALYSRKKTVRDPGPAGRMAARARAALAEARIASGDAVYAWCSKALIAAVLSRAGREGEALTCEELADMLAASGADPAQTQELAALRQRLDAARFGGERARPEDLVVLTEAAVGRLLA